MIYASINQFVDSSNDSLKEIRAQLNKYEIAIKNRNIQDLISEDENFLDELNSIEMKTDNDNIREQVKKLRLEFNSNDSLKEVFQKNKMEIQEKRIRQFEKAKKLYLESFSERIKDRYYDLDLCLAKIKEAKNKYPKLEETFSPYEAKCKKESMRYYSGSPIGIAISNTEFRRSCGNKTSTGDFRYLYAGVSTKNFGNRNLHVNPNHFNIQTPSGEVFNTVSEMYSLNNYFDATNLPSGGMTSGFLVFLVPVEKEYKLYFNSISSSETKKIYL